MISEFLTLKQNAEYTVVEKKSRFIGAAAPVTSEREAVAFIEAARLRHRDARHHVYAYVINDGGVIGQRCSDDGEPQGTGGIPVLDVLRKQKIVNAVIVVTRYFGGVLLGAPGLVRAYGKAAALAAEEAGLVRMRLYVPLRITVDYSLYGKLINYFEPLGISQEPPLFQERVTAVFPVPADTVERHLAAVADLSCGQAETEIGDKRYYPG